MLNGLVMDYFSPNIDELVTELPGAKRSLVQTFIAKPSESIVLTKGTLFGLVEIAASKQRTIELINVIIEEIEGSYYNNPDEMSSSSDLEAAFEAALQKTNIAIAAFLENSHIKIDLSKINIAIGLLYHKKIYFAHVGSVGIFLFQKLSSKGHRIINILEVSRTPLIAPSPLKMFSQVITGSLGSRDVLALLTPSILDYFSLERIKNILTTGDGLVQFKQSIDELQSDYNFGVVLLSIERRNVAEPIPMVRNEFNYQKAAYKDSMRELDKTERETAKLLTPSVFPEIKKYTAVLKDGFQGYLSKIKDAAAGLSKKAATLKVPPVHLPAIKRPTLARPERPQEKINPAQPVHYQPRQRPTVSVKKVAAQLISAPQVKAASLAASRLLQRVLPQQWWQRVTALPTSSKVLLGFSILLALLFFQSVIWNGITNRRAEKIEQFAQIILDAETKTNEAEASLIYRDENKARELLIAVNASLAGLEPPTKSQTEQITALRQEIETQLQSLRHMINVEEPVLIANFKNIDDQAVIAPVLTAVGSALYTQNQAKQSLFKVDTVSRSITTTFLTDTQTGSFQLGTTISNSEVLFITTEKKVYALNPNNGQIQPLDFVISEQSAIADITTYNGRLYLLDSGSNQIYRYQKTATGYGNAAGWVTDDRIDLSDATSMVVDGSVYVLHRSGKIDKLQNGRITTFNSPIIDPVFAGPTKIKTTAESKFLYILDPPAHRLVVTDKEGRLVIQYTAAVFDDLKDFLVVEAEKKLYLLSGSAVYGIPATHLE